MNNVSSVRLTIPKAANGEITRRGLIEKIIGDKKRFVYVHAGAGYGKTTLLSQIARSSENAVWFSLAGESDIFTFVNTLCEAVRQPFPEYGFIASEYLPFMEKDNFITILANSLIASMEHLSKRVMLIFDDLQTIKNVQIKELISCFMRFASENIWLCLGSREAPWQQLMPLSIRGCILELKQNELAFTQKEASVVLGFDDAETYHITEGWPLAIGSFRVLLENGVSPEEVPSQGNEALYSYLFYECISRLSSEMVDFLKASACFEELDAPMLDAVLNRKNSKLMLESLVARNLFTIKTGGEHYRYHALFKKCLLETGDVLQQLLLRQKAARYYWNEKDFSRAAEYAVCLNDQELLQKIILASYRYLMSSGNFSELRQWFQALGDDLSESEPEIFVAKGAFFSSIGNFIEARKYLDIAIPLLNKGNSELFLDAMVHKARVLRNYVSFEASDELLDELMSGLDNYASETAYSIIIEKLYNLCWNSKINEAYALAKHVIDECARAGNLKIKAWFERYLSAIHFFAGRMKKTIYYYEKSLELPEDEREYLDMHGIAIYVAKAYQMMGDRVRSLSILTDALQKMRSRGKYEEMWSGYLFAAEIHFQNTSIDRSNGKNTTYETTMKYFTLADEYAPLYRKTDFQMQWAKMQQLTYSLMFLDCPKEGIIQEIFTNLDKGGSYLICIVLARLMGYFAAVHDLQNAAKCAKQCIEVGENAGMLLHSTLAYGVLARAAIAAGKQDEARIYTERHLRLCSDNGIYEYFRARKDYDHILQFASDNGVELETLSRLMEFSGCHIKKAYIKTFGGFSVFPYKDRTNAVKMRTRKERELFAFILDAGEQGVTKEQIYEAIWSESESENIKRLIGVNLTQIKKDLSGLEIENPVICREKRYSICRDKIACDFDLFEDIAGKIGNTTNREEVLKVLSLYAGEYLSDFEAFWATSKRIQYRKIFEANLKLTENSSVK